MCVHELVPTELDADSDRDLETVTIDDGDVLEALSSETARRVLQALDSGPAPASAVAETAGVSIQVAAYHLDRLETAGLVRTVATSYSEKGQPMDIYGLTTDSFVVELSGGDSPH